MRGDFRMIISMAFRNLSRHRVKTVITATAVAVSVSLYIFMDAWVLGMNLDSRRNIVIYEMGAAKIQTPAYFSKKDELPMYESFGDWEEIVSSLEKTGFDAAPRFVFSGTLYSRTGSAPVVFNAVDTVLEKKLLRYPEYIQTGRFPKAGKLEIALGYTAAEKLHAGIPEHPYWEEYEQELLAAATDSGERDFIESLYVPYGEPEKKKSLFADTEREKRSEKRYSLRKNVTESELSRFWEILSAAGRMDVRISTTIDIKALPERIQEEKFNRDILPLFSGEERRLLLSAYSKDPLLGDYILTGGTENTRNRLLSVLLGSDYSGAVRHVNQLIDAVVTGVVNSPNPKTNSNIAYMPLDSLQDEAGLMLDGRVTEILIRSASAKDSDLPRKDESPDAILEALAGTPQAARFTETAGDESSSPDKLSVYGWKEYAKDYLAASAGDNISTRVMILFLFILSFLGIANTMLMAILERTRETGMLRALGMTDRQLILAYAAEAAMIGVIGSAAGVVIGCLVNFPMVNTGIDYSAVTEAMGGDIGYRIASHFRSAWNIPAILGTFFTAVILSGCMAILPTLRALKMAVTETLRFE